jgi:hypothetical protein
MDWWKMNNATNTPRVGSVNAISLQSGVNVSSVAGGKYANATSLNSQGTPVFSTSSCGNITVPVTGLAYAGAGIDAFVWIKIPTGNSNTTFSLFFSNSSGTTVWSMNFVLAASGSVTLNAPGGGSSPQPLVYSALYQLFEIYYDPSIGGCGIRVNNGALVDAGLLGIGTLATTAKGSLSIIHARTTAGTAGAEVCEMAVYSRILTAAQRSYIYNAGAGRTWPVTLP